VCNHREHLRKLDSVVDELLSLAAKLSLAERVLVEELKLRDQWRAGWAITARKMASTFADDSAGLDGPEFLELVQETLRANRRPYLKEQGAVYQERAEAIYLLGKREAFENTTGYKTTGPATKEIELSKAAPVFATNLTLADTAAIEALSSQQVFWIGQHYSEGLSTTIAGAAEEAVLINGLSGLEAGSAMEAALLGLASVPTLVDILPAMGRARPDQYFAGLAMNATTVARNVGRVHTFKRLGVVRVELINPMDKTTTEICALLNGTVLEVEWLEQQIEKMAQAKTPEEVKEIWPWNAASDIETDPAGNVVSGNVAGVHLEAGQAATADEAKAMAEAGIATPPFHWKCRTIAEVTEEVDEFDVPDDFSRQ
jgi:hypothetical protein